MRSFPLFFSLSVAALVSGCGGDGGDTALNPATNVDLVFSTFDLVDVSGKPPNLEYTRFYDVYRALEPNPDNADHDNEKVLATALRDHIDGLLGHVRNDTEDGFKRVRNPLDLMNQVVASGEVANFVAGRQYISDRIDLGMAGTYNTRSNGASIRFADQSAANAGEPLANRQWIYDTLSWAYVPQDPDGNDGFEKVFRVVQYVARMDSGDDENATQQLTSLTSSSQFKAANFSVNGYNEPEYTIASFASRSLGDMELRQDFVMDKTDTLFLKDSGVDLGSGSQDCIRVELDYPMSEVRIYTSNGEPSQYDDDTDDSTPDVDNPNYCGFKDTADKTYTAITLAERQ